MITARYILSIVESRGADISIRGKKYVDPLLVNKTDRIYKAIALRKEKQRDELLRDFRGVSGYQVLAPNDGNSISFSREITFHDVKLTDYFSTSEGKRKFDSFKSLSSSAGLRFISGKAPSFHDLHAQDSLWVLVEPYKLTVEAEISYETYKRVGPSKFVNFLNNLSRLMQSIESGVSYLAQAFKSHSADFSNRFSIIKSRI